MIHPEEGVVVAAPASMPHLNARNGTTMSDQELCYLSATEAIALFQKRQLSPVELVQALITRTEQVNPLINAYTYTFYERALSAAKQAEAKYNQTDGNPRPLEGIPLAIKDLHAIKGEITTYGSKLFADNRDSHTIPTVERLLQAGAILLARTTTAELGAAIVTHSPLWGVTCNPWNRQFSPGGSSGGSAAALAAGIITLADGSDYGGSIRIPASCCGVFGFKPPFGRNPSDNPYNLDVYNHYGPIARTVSDGALMQNVMSGYDRGDIMTLKERVIIPQNLADIRGWKIAYSLDLGYFEVAPEVQQNTLQAVEIFRSLGCQVEEVEIGWTMANLDAFMTHAAPGIGGVLRDLPEDSYSQLSDYVVYLLRRSQEISALELLATHQVRAKMYEELAPILEQYNVLICPTTAVPSVPAQHSPLDPLFQINNQPVQALIQWAMTYPFNMLSQCPVASVPSGFSSSGIPTGLQIVGRTFDDESVFRAAAAFERVQPWLNTSECRPKLI